MSVLWQGSSTRQANGVGHVNITGIYTHMLQQSYGVARSRLESLLMIRKLYV